MADNPIADFLTQLNGIIVKQGQLGLVTGYSGYTDTTVDATGYSPITFTGTGQLIITTTYQPGFTQTLTNPANGVGYDYYMAPIFGTLKLKSFGQAASIVGFTKDTLVLDWGTPGTGKGEAGLINFKQVVKNSKSLAILHLGGPITASDFPVTFTTDYTALCFAEGTMIETPEGVAAVEDLREGDMVRTASGAARPVKWRGELVSRPSRHPRPSEVQPVRVSAHAFGPDMPRRDVRLSPGHAVFVDGVLVPVGNLVNGATIVQESVEEIRYFHVELDSHDVLLAEGLPCESYFDDGNRASFVNAEGFTLLHGRMDPQSWDDACAPMVAAGPQLTELQQRLHARAEALGWVKTEAADPVIEANGVRIAPVHASGHRYWFAVPAADVLTLRSNHGVLAHTIPGLGDGRMLGVAVAEVRIDGVALDLDADAFGAGFYPVERHDGLGWRWTDGAAVLTHALAEPAMVEMTLAMVAPSWVRPVPVLRVVA